MKKVFRIFVIVIIILVTLSLTLSPIFAQENLQVPNKEVSNKVDELVELKDNDTLSDEEKEIKEIRIRKEALGKITDLSLLEIKNLEDKINSLSFESDAQNKIKEAFLEILNKNKVYSEDLKLKAENEELTLEEVKDLAQEFKDWREENYNKHIKKLTVFILTFQEKNVLKTANIRLEKIIVDIKKLESAKIIKKEDTWKYIESAMKSLANAQILNSDAEETIIATIEKTIINIATSTPEIAMEIGTTTPEKIETKKAEQIEGPALSLAIQAATSTPKIITEEESAQTLIEESLKEIKSAYTNFISISNKVKAKLK